MLFRLNYIQTIFFLVIIIYLFTACSEKRNWILQTEDTKLVLRVNDNSELLINELSDTKNNLNWLAENIPFPLLDKISVDSQFQSLSWKLTRSSFEGDRLTLVFANEQPAMELISIWHAHEGPGPVRNTMFIKNNAAHSVTIYNQESIVLPALDSNRSTRITYINDDASMPDSIGVYHMSTDSNFVRILKITEKHDWIPFIIIDDNDQNGMYVGWEWSIGRISIEHAENIVTVKAGIGDDFRTDLDAGEVFEVPPAFIGAYHGDLDDGGNSLRKYLFKYSMPSLVRDDESFPKVEWNAFAALASKESMVNPLERKYYPLIDDIAPLGFEEVVIDIGWWMSYGDPGHIIVDSIDWPKGIPAAAKYAKERGMRFGLYDNESENLTSESGKKERFEDISYLINDLGADFYRSDATAGPVAGGSYGKDQRAKYKEDVGYWSIRGFYEVIDSLYRAIPTFLWENCSSGGGLKDFGAVSRASKVQNQDVYYPLEARRSFYDATFAMHPMQLACVVGSWEPFAAQGSGYEFRSASMGAAYWHPDAPSGGDWGPAWSEQGKLAIKDAVHTYKTRLRPLIRNGNLYHIFPRPTGKIWDGIQYYDPSTQKGVVYAFKHEALAGNDSQLIKLKGLDPDMTYKLNFEDKSNEPIVKKGSELMNTGFNMTLKGSLISELVFLEKQ